MGLLDVLRGGIAVANKVTRPLQSQVTYERDLGEDAFGTRQFGSPTVLHALVDYKSVQVRTQDGILTVSRAVITLIDINEVVAATAGEGIGNNDKFTLPDGDTGPTLDIGGFVDAGTKHPMATTVMIG